MSYYSSVCISILTLAVFSCGSSRKDASQETDSRRSDSAQIAKMQADTVPDMPSPPEPAPAPGTLRLQGKVIGIQPTGKDSSIIYEIKVLQTLEMGAGTPAVVRNDIVRITSSKPSPKISEGADILCLIKHRRVMAEHQDSAASWQLLQWESNTNQD